MARQQESRGSSSDTPAGQPVPGSSKAGYVQYVGLSDRRGITKEDFAAHGVEHESLWWTRQNNWRVPLSKISDDAYQIAIEHDPELVLVPTEG